MLEDSKMKAEQRLMAEWVVVSKETIVSMCARRCCVRDLLIEKYYKLCFRVSFLPD